MNGTAQYKKVNRCEDCLENCLVLQSRQEEEPGSLQQPQHSTQIYEIYEIYENYGIVAHNIQHRGLSRCMTKSTIYREDQKQEQLTDSTCTLYTVQYMLLLCKQA